jgi:hypothetical protein
MADPGRVDPPARVLFAASKAGPTRASDEHANMAALDPTAPSSGRFGVITRLLPVGGLVAACSAAAPPPVEVALDPPLRPPLPAQVSPQPVDDRACELGAGAVVRRFEIALAPLGRPFAEVTRARTATVRLGSDGAMAVTLDAGGVTLSGFVDPAATPLYATEPLVLAGAVVPLGWTGLTFLGLSTEGVQIALGPDALPSFVSGLDEAPARGTAACSSLSLVPGRFPVGSALPTRPIGAAMLVGEAVLLSAEPAAEPALTLWPDPDAPPVVHLLARVPGRARIGWVLAETVVFGWVDGAHITDTEALPPAPLPSAGVRLEHSVRAPTRLSCPTSVPVLAEVDGEARFIGHVEAGKVMGVEMNDAEGFLLGVEGAAFHPYSYSELRVRAADLLPCTTHK